MYGLPPKTPTPYGFTLMTPGIGTWIYRLIRYGLSMVFLYSGSIKLLEPDVFAAHAYDGMNMIIQSIEKVGLNRVLIRDVLTDMETFQGYRGITGEIIFDATWNDVGPIWIAEIREGDFIFSPASWEWE